MVFGSILYTNIFARFMLVLLVIVRSESRHALNSQAGMTIIPISYSQGDPISVSRSKVYWTLMTTCNVLYPTSLKVEGSKLRWLYAPWTIFGVDVWKGRVCGCVKGDHFLLGVSVFRFNAGLGKNGFLRFIDDLKTFGNQMEEEMKHSWRDSPTIGKRAFK